MHHTGVTLCICIYAFPFPGLQLIPTWYYSYFHKNVVENQIAKASSCGIKQFSYQYYTDYSNAEHQNTRLMSIMFKI